MNPSRTGTPQCLQVSLDVTYSFLWKLGEKSQNASRDFHREASRDIEPIKEEMGSVKGEKSP